jgi:hypothetical protein
MTRRSAERESFLADIVTTAVEGGINYWARVSGYRWHSPDMADGGGSAEPSPAGGGNAYCTVHEMGDEEEPIAEHKLTIDTIAHAFTVARDPDVKINPGYRAKLIELSLGGDDVDYDAGDADNLVQLGLFGELVYG